MIVIEIENETQVCSLKYENKIKKVLIIHRFCNRISYNYELWYFQNVFLRFNARKTRAKEANEKGEQTNGLSIGRRTSVFPFHHHNGGY